MPSRYVSRKKMVYRHKARGSERVRVSDGCQTFMVSVYLTVARGGSYNKSAQKSRTVPLQGGHLKKYQLCVVHNHTRVQKEFFYFYFISCLRVRTECWVTEFCISPLFFFSSPEVLRQTAR